MWGYIESVYGNGTDLPQQMTAAYHCSSDTPNGWVAISVYAPFRNTLIQFETGSIITQLGQSNTFGIRYDLPSASFVIITATNLNITGDFSLANAR